MTATQSNSRILLLFAAVLLAIAPGCRSTSINPSPTPAAEVTPSALASSPALATPSVSATPSPSALSSAPIDCSNPTDQSINVCAQQAYESADAKLNQVYRRFKHGLSQKEQSELVDVETTWLKFRDSSCEFESSQAGSQETQPSVRYQCLEQATKDRIAELQMQSNPL